MALEFSPEAYRQFQETVARYPRKEAAILPVLYLAQQEFGYLGPEAIDYVARLIARELGPLLTVPAGDRERRGRDEGQRDGDNQRHTVHVDRVRARELRRRECHDQPHDAMGEGDANDRTRGRDDRRVGQRQEQ